MTMKKTLLFASALSLVLLAGCTKEQPAATAPGAENKLTISGSIVTPDTKIQIGEPANGKAPILWENGDEIMIAAANSQGNVPKTSWDASMNRIQYGGLATATTTSPSQSTYFSCESFNGDLTNDTYTLWGVYAADQRFVASKDTPISTLCYLPDLSSQTYGQSNPYLMVASTQLKADQTTANLQFTNTTAILMLNVKGTAKIDKISIKQVNMQDNSSSAVLAYSYGMGGYANFDLTKAPKAGGTAADFANFVVLPTDKWSTPATPVSEVTVTTTNLQLSEESVAIPVGVCPFDLTADDALIVTVYGTGDDFSQKSVACTVAPGATSITSNSIAYINLDPFTAEEFGQTPPKTDWAAGDIVLNDDFSWITSVIDWVPSEGGDDSGEPDWGYPGMGGAMSYTDLGGWTNSYINQLFPYYNYLDNSNGADAYLTQRGYTYSGYTILLWYENKGMIGTVDDYGGTGTLSYTMSKLNNYKGNVTVTFKACRATDANGGDNYGMLPATFDVSLSGNGTIDGNTSVTLGSADYAPFSFYEYTLVIENADLTTTLNFADAMYLDDLKITISEATDANQLTGIEVVKPAATLVYSSPVNNTDTELPATDAADQMFTFKVTGPWKATYSDNVATKSADNDGVNKWLQLSTASWSFMQPSREDAYGNLVPTVFQLTNIKDNTTGAPRTATVQIVSLDDTEVYATYTFTQDAQ